MDLAATVQRTEDIFSFISKCVCFRIVKSIRKENVCKPLYRMHFRCAVLDVGIWMGYKIGNWGSGLKQLSCPWHFNEEKKKRILRFGTIIIVLFSLNFACVMKTVLNILFHKSTYMYKNIYFYSWINYDKPLIKYLRNILVWKLI